MRRSGGNPGTQQGLEDRYRHQPPHEQSRARDGEGQTVRQPEAPPEEGKADDRQRRPQHEGAHLLALEPGDREEQQTGDGDGKRPPSKRITHASYTSEANPKTAASPGEAAFCALFGGQEQFSTDHGFNQRLVTTTSSM